MVTFQICIAFTNNELGNLYIVNFSDFNEKVPLSIIGFITEKNFMSWKTSKIKASLWIQAQIRKCDLNFIPIIIRQKGDPNSGAILLKLDRGKIGFSILSQCRDLNGKPGWIYGGGAEYVNDTEAEAYIKRQIERDPDLWVVEIEDPKGRFQLDGDIV